MNATTIAAIIRHALGIFSGFLIAKGIELDATSIETISGALGSLIAIGWSLKQKKTAAPKTALD
jgi:hypothetical protein